MATAPSKIKSKAQPSKPIFKTANPYASTQWPAITPALQQEIADALLELLAPIGAWRSEIPRSKGKRAKQRKRKHERDTDKPDNSDQAKHVQKPAPYVLSYVTVGYNTTIRAMDAQVLDHISSEGQLVAVFLTHPSHSIQYAHLPVLAAQAKPRILLVPLSEGSEKRLCAALGLARAGLLGIREEAPGAAALISLIQGVDQVSVPCLDQMKQGQWLGVTVGTTHANT